MTSECGDLWVFGYGSLMWRPGFDYLERVPARLNGYHRDFCVWSHRYRGTPEKPGLVLGLDRGGSCRGIAYRVADGKKEEVLAYLHEREMITGVYAPRILPVAVPESGRQVAAQAYVVDRSHAQYAAGLTPEERAALILQGHGTAGPGRDYLANTVGHLAELGLTDRRLSHLLALVDGMLAGTLPVPVPPAGPPAHPANRPGARPDTAI
ncbi:gamma-glutamylcyclotransferase [Nisaea acidiphila]|uniref:glutathione-specific gamma-glutamylcyclotransferase n=1 Tax=Nisaea acidiphila TaxID=1862145 RepID=A0A9J7AMH6_9PROT|nr:gamma-glutamylcyclotransferase [Nisaea acidiphila]UUX48162.1 gamma-glutamylcyclotransferase [Nisaea acidiphila]